MSKKMGKIATLVTAASLAMTGCQKPVDKDYDTICKITNVKKDTKGGVDETIFSVFCEDGDKITQVSLEENYDEGNIEFSNFNANTDTESNMTLAGDLCPSDVTVIVTDFEHNIKSFNGKDIYVGENICSDSGEEIKESYESDDIINESY